MGLPCPPPGDLPNLGTETRFPALAGEFFTTEQSEAGAAKSLQSCLTLCDPIDGSPPGSAVPGILQADSYYSTERNLYAFQNMGQQNSLNILKMI